MASRPRGGKICEAHPARVVAISRLFERLGHDVADAFFGNMRGEVSPGNNPLKLVVGINHQAAGAAHARQTSPRRPAVRRPVQP